MTTYGTTYGAAPGSATGSTPGEAVTGAARGETPAHDGTTYDLTILRRAPLARLARVELGWIFRRPRTLVVLGLLTVIPVITGVAMDLSMTPVAPSTDGTGPGPGAGPPLLLSMATSAFALPLGSLMTLLMLMLPLTVAMASGDALAGEQSHGALRGWLLAPVSRGRLLLIKSLGVLVVALVASTLVVLSGFVTGLVLGGTDALISMSGTELSIPDVLGRLAIAVGWATCYLMAIGGIALAISASTEHPMLVVVSVLGGVIVSVVLWQITALEPLHPFLLPTLLTRLTDLIRDPLPLDGMIGGLLPIASYFVIGITLAYARLVTKDG